MKSPTNRLISLASLLFLLSACAEKVTSPPPIQKPAIGLDFSDLYDQSPNIGSCSGGLLKASERVKVLEYVNSIRSLHGLSPVTYSSSDDKGVTDAAVIMISNNILDHSPPASYSCWTQDGFTAANKSNLAFNYEIDTGTILAPSLKLVDLWFKDSLVGSLGHRRWLIDPFLKQIAFGRADKIQPNGTYIESRSAAAIRVIFDEHQTPSPQLEYVAYPFGDYPSRLYNSLLDMSFSVVVDRNDFFKNNAVNFSATSITIKDPNGNQIPVSNVRTNLDPYGLGNIVYWNANLQIGPQYTVSVRNVTFNGATKTFTYNVKLV
jgi:uncharacterized protein YkwD